MLQAVGHAGKIFPDDPACVWKFASSEKVYRPRLFISPSCTHAEEKVLPISDTYLESTLAAFVHLFIFKMRPCDSRSIYVVCFLAAVKVIAPDELELAN